MKEQGHPNYRKVLFVDTSTGHKFVIGSTATTDKTATHEGVEYPLVEVSISSASHPFFTGSTTMVDSEGRVAKFNRRFGKKAS